MKTLIVAALLLVSAGAARSDNVWTYTGSVMAGCHCSLSGSVTLDSANQPVSYDFTDGTHELTNLNSLGKFETTLLGNPLPLFHTWEFQLTTSPVYGDTSKGITFISYFYGSYFEATDLSFVNGASFGYLEGDKGTWSDPVGTPEPGSLLLMGLGLGLCMAGRKKLKTLYHRGVE